MRVLVSVDMEGVAGVVDPQDISPGNAEYERNRGYMTDEASAAVRGVLAHDPAAEVVVCDAHAQFRNLIPDRLEQGCTLLRGSPRRLAMMTGIERGVDAVCFVGYHGRAGTPDSVLAHTISGGVIANVRCDGRELGELGLNAALASFHGAVPVLATGDDTLAAEAASVVPGITTVMVKRAVANRAAEGLHPRESCRRIEAAAQAALAHPEVVHAPVFQGPVDLEVDVLRPSMTERALGIPGVERRAPLTLGFTAADFGAAYDLIEVFTVLAAAP
ncbi:M55 family metallopeptidase [Allobranchiibius sp. CTAmp26]|uniref:M55 family metallopeptidase n=1 Tax=Allobranchiibius sp. CTAmp26 TaxID=2815214 RepID=UPI001AA0F913|nr:M55 family metallopeptidase [Allobranchiibius sp. CTAmp26]MBO1756721.1 M55 family metallopeptidase [Allobranchiibius sp. CTAmp26]